MAGTDSNEPKLRAVTASVQRTSDLGGYGLTSGWRVTPREPLRIIYPERLRVVTLDVAPVSPT